MREVVIVSAARTPIGRFGGALAAIPATELGAVAIREALKRRGIDPSIIDEALMGNVLLAGEGQAPARQAAIRAGIPPTVGATTLNKVCGSGLKAVMMAAQAIKAGDAEVIVAGGMENMDQAPYLLREARRGYRLGHGELTDAAIHDGLWCPFENKHMGHAAEWIAREYDLRREELDAFALRSHQRAIAAMDGGLFSAEIAPVTIPQRKGSALIFEMDESPRRDSSLEALARLQPAFEEKGLVTAGNSSPLSDGAAALVIMAADKAASLGHAPLARILGYAQAGVEPLRLFTAPALAIRALLQKCALALGDFDLIELNEAFAAQALANGKELGLDWDRVNVNGGAIALGHPIGCSGARILVTLLYALRARGLRRGLTALCLGGGEAVAMAVETV
jgi:acetyl-CoA C-acetyltransferase